MSELQHIESRIYTVRGQRVMLDRDLAALYEVETRVFNQAVKRNAKRFPEDFMFQLLPEEWEALRSQIVTLNAGRGGHTKYRPHVFTEQGVAMLSGVLNSDRAISMNIAIMRAFVEIRKAALLSADMQEQLRAIQDRLSEHDTQLSGIYDAIENLLDTHSESKSWEERERIGFKK
jgi:hypothetical protein